jgi:hypothetical protein
LSAGRFCDFAPWHNCGHRSHGITDTYAELDQALAVEAARKLC